MKSLINWLKSKPTPLILSVPVIAVISLVFPFLEAKFGNGPISYLEAGTLVVLGITLIVLIVYARDTGRIADATSASLNLQQRIHLTPKAMFEVRSPTPISDGNQNLIGYDTPFWVHNFSSSFYIEAWVEIGLKCYGQQLFLRGEAYHKGRPWKLAPNSLIKGHFKVDNEILSQVNRDILDLNKSNEEDALTLDPDIICKNHPHKEFEFQIPKIHYHFDFKRKGWILDI